jgi:DNA-binding transcriptional LysR family regulator
VPQVPPTPDLAELRTFCVAADLGGVGRAAVRLGVSQPSLSKRLRSLEGTGGARLLERSPHGVTLTPAGRRLYEHARGLLEQADAVSEVMLGLRRAAGPVRLAASHSAAEAFVTAALARLSPGRPLAVELVTGNSQVVRGMVADGRADVGFAASRPGHTPNPGVRTERIADDAVVCAVPPAHRWSRRRAVGLDEFLATPMVLRDPGSNARWTVEAVLRERGLELPPPAAQTPTPAAAMHDAIRRNAPLLLSRHVIAGSELVPVEIEGVSFPREYQVVLPAYGESGGDVRDLIEGVREHVRIWLR